MLSQRPGRWKVPFFHRLARGIGVKHAGWEPKKPGDCDPPLTGVNHAPVCERRSLMSLVHTRQAVRISLLWKHGSLGTWLFTQLGWFWDCSCLRKIAIPRLTCMGHQICWGKHVEYRLRKMGICKIPICRRQKPPFPSSAISSSDRLATPNEAFTVRIGCTNEPFFNLSKEVRVAARVRQPSNAGKPKGESAGPKGAMICRMDCDGSRNVFDALQQVVSYGASVKQL